MPNPAAGTQSVLLLAFKYPPYNRIGSYRWAKLSKYLARQGVQVHVLTVDWLETGGAGYSDDVAGTGITIHRIPSGFVHNLRYREIDNRLLQILRNRFVFTFERAFMYGGESMFWGRHVVPAAIDLIHTHGIRTLIATGGPFMTNLWACDIKQQLPQVNVIQDLRDVWLHDPHGYIHLLPPHKLQRLQGFQDRVINEADKVVVAARTMAELYVDDNNPPDKFVFIPNGYDPDTLPPADTGTDHLWQQGYGPRSFCFCGSVNNQREPILADFLRVVRDQQPTLADARVVCVGRMHPAIESEFSDLITQGVLEIHPPMPQADAFDFVRRCRFGLNVIAQEWGISTKIFEYAMLQRPTLTLCMGGGVIDFVRDNNLGLAVNMQQPDPELLTTLIADGGIDADFGGVGRFSYASLAGDYRSLVEALESDAPAG